MCNFRRTDFGVVRIAVAWRGVLTSLHTKLVKAGSAYLGGQLDVAAGLLPPF